MRGRRSATSADEGQTPRRSAHDKALAMLARREHSRRELATRLERDGYTADETNEALASLAEANYQSDQRFAEMMVRSRIRQGYGPQRLRAELRTHDIPDALIGELLAEAEADWLTQAREQLQRRYGDTAPGDYRERAKRMQFLVRRGFDTSTARAATE
ncbi:MAG TPA: regulatory protein RecX [Rhodanobacteraceae bacterium]|nr:regulatory protein RecX [Rhodanobacteraceae bacterium]